MSLAAIFNVPVDRETLAQWSFAHAAHHRDIIRVIYEISGIALPEYLLDPFDPAGKTNWEYTHQVMHTQMNAILGVAGNDLLSLDWADENKRAAWVLLCASEHRQVGDILGLG